MVERGELGFRRRPFCKSLGVIPRILHFNYFGLDTTARNFPLIYYIAIRSAVEWIKPDKVLFYNTREPGGKYWDAVKPLLTRVPCEPPTEIFGRPLLHYAHQSDIVRLRALIATGGIYLDMDTVCRRSFDDLLSHPAVMGVQRFPNEHLGLCNAVILSEPNNPFMLEWLESYRTFRSKGRDKRWDEHGVRLPWKLARMNDDGKSGHKDLHVEPPESFFEPSWWPSEHERLFDRVEEFPAAYCHHLCETASYQRYLQTITEQYIREVDTTYNLAARPFLPGLE